MAHLKTQMDLHTKHFLSGKTKKVKAVESQCTVATNADEETNYVSNQGGFQGNSQGN